MASRHSLQGLMKWLTREQWRERFEQVLEDHLLPACEETGLEADDIVSTLGEELFMSTVWACAFEDMLTREFDDGSNIVDDYLKRRGWKETAPTRNYMAALRNSVVSLYEVSDVVRDTSFRARDILRGGEPVLISERSATRSLKQWDRIAGRVVRLGSQTLISGAVLLYEYRTSEDFVEAWRKFGKLTRKERQELVEAIEQDFDEAKIADLSETERLRTISPMVTTFWLIEMIDQAGQPEFPDLRNAEGDELLLCTARYPFAAGATDDDIRAALDSCPDLRRETAALWNWINREKPAATSRPQVRPPESLTFETTLDDGALVLGNVEMQERALVLAVNSRPRSDRGRLLLSEILGERVGQPSVETESVEQMLASRDADIPQQLDIPEEERCAILHDHLDRHYRDALDQPIPMLGDKSPRAAVRTASGRTKVAGWLKMIENRTAKSADHDGAMANYSFDWLWTELGIDKLRQ